MREFINDLQEGYYIFQIKNTGEKEARSNTKYVFPFVFIGYYVGVFCLIVRVIVYVLKTPPVAHNFKNYLIAALVLFTPYIFIYKFIFKTFGNRIISYEKGKEGNRQKFWKFLVFFLLSLASLVIFPLMFDLWIWLQKL
jgi:hypothetical protein